MSPHLRDPIAPSEIIPSEPKRCLHCIVVDLESRHEGIDWHPKAKPDIRAWPLWKVGIGENVDEALNDGTISFIVDALYGCHLIDELGVDTSKRLHANIKGGMHAVADECIVGSLRVATHRTRCIRGTLHKQCTMTLHAMSGTPHAFLLRLEGFGLRGESVRR